jgi:hypothetical protein
MAPSGYPNEKALHDLVEEAPSVLPLSGSPRLTIIGREVALGTGLADLLAVEEDGRPVVIEIKLANNSEARRAVIAQVLSYAAALYGMTLDEVEGRCARYLGSRRLNDISSAVASESQTGPFDGEAFRANLTAYLASGEFRVVVVLDDAPADLISIARYLSDMGGRLLVDVLTVHQFTMGSGEGGETLLVPERVDLDRTPPSAVVRVSRQPSEGQLLEGPDAFIAAANALPEERRAPLRSLADWAQALHSRGLIDLHSFVGKTQTTLLPRLRDENVGLISAWTSGGANVGIWRSVFERRAPNALATLEQLVAPKTLGQGTGLNISDELLQLLTVAYEEATGALQR